MEIFFCDELEQEFLDVAHRPKIQKLVDERQVLRVHQLMTLFCHRVKASIQSVTPVRDPKDVCLLALADAVKADFLVSGDSDLTDLQQHNQTKIIDFREIPQLIAAEEKG